MNMRIVLLALLVIALAACRNETAETSPATGQPGSETPASAPASVGATMPAYTAQTLEGEKFDLSSTRGSVVLLNIWATWCGPCRYEIPELIELHQTYEGRGFQVIGASVDGPESVSEVAPMVKERKINYPIVLDPEGKIADIFETNVIPTSALLDRTGKIVWTRIGTVEADDPELIAAIEGALGS